MVDLEIATHDSDSVGTGEVDGPMDSISCSRLVAAVVASPAELIGSYGGVVGAARAGVGDSLLGCFAGLFS